MPKSLLRVPYTSPLPHPTIIPRTANTTTGAVEALTKFLTASPSPKLRAHNHPNPQSSQTVLLTGAGISVASGLADYRGAAGTYTLNRTYRPIYYNEFCTSHEARKRYWARSFLGWTNLHHARPNTAHKSIRDLASMGYISACITQNVDSFHPLAHPDLPTLELHGYLRSCVCLSCGGEYPRDEFQQQLSALNPTWTQFLEQALESGALTTENPEERAKRGLKTNPDGDVDLPSAPFNTFRYPSCPSCLADPPMLDSGGRAKVEIDEQGAWLDTSNAGILKPAVVMFGESISQRVKDAAEKAVDDASRILVLGSSLATYSAWRLVKRARENGMPVGILNLGGVRGEESFFQGYGVMYQAEEGFRASESTEKVLPKAVDILRGRAMKWTR